MATASKMTNNCGCEFNPEFFDPPETGHRCAKSRLVVRCATCYEPYLPATYPLVNGRWYADISFEHHGFVH
jgi:hypothetical protein